MLYHAGQDTEAMDRFMDIIIKGDPSEKALATEYISKITMRLEPGLSTQQARVPEPAAVTDLFLSGPAIRPEVLGGSAAGISAGPWREEDQARQELANEKISSRIALLRRDLLCELGEAGGVKIYMGDGVPKAIVLNPAYLFSDAAASKAGFRPGAGRLLQALAGLIFTLGKASCLVLPEGTALEDVALNGLRRAVVLASYFQLRGISTARLEADLTGYGVSLPRELLGESGIVLLFDYSGQPRLKDPGDLKARGPKVSLGVYPPVIAVQNNEGAIIEFSVSEGAGGRPSWKFQIFGVLKDGSRLLLREISGSGAKYHQFFWNGRNKFFGTAYPSGRYLISVTAVDLEGRATSVRRQLTLATEAKALKSVPVGD